MSSKSDLVIIGAGLTGMALAYFLKNEKISIQILEASPSLGGRIQTIKKNNLAPIEMGATWYGKKHTNLIQLLAELNIDSFEQILGESAIYEPLSTNPPHLVKLPPNEEETSYRIKDGTITLIERLNENLSEKCSVNIHQKVVSIEKAEGGVTVNTESKKFHCDVVVSTLPPHLLLNTIKLTPEVPSSLKDIMKETHTWMGESIKFGLHFNKPFWRDANSSGTIFSNVGPIQEMYEHTNYANTQFALKGFLNGAYHTMSRNQRKNLVLAQLRKYYGNKVDTFLHYEEKVWQNAPLTYSAYDMEMFPHQNNGNPMFQQPLYDDKFFIAGSETSLQFPGYMEGAVQRAKSIAKTLVKKG